MNNEDNILEKWKTIEELLDRDDTLNLKDEFKTSLKINKFGGQEDADAWRMIALLKKKNISISKHIRMLLALEFREELLLPSLYTVNGCGKEQFEAQQTTKEINNIETEKEEVVADYNDCEDDGAFD